MKKLCKIFFVCLITLTLFSFNSCFTSAKKVNITIPRELRGKWIVKHMIDGQYFILSSKNVEEGRLQSDSYSSKVISVKKHKQVYTVKSYSNFAGGVIHVYRFKKSGKKIIYYINKHYDQFIHKNHLVMHRFSKLPKNAISIN